MENKNKQIIIAVMIIGLVAVGASAMFLKNKKIDSNSVELNKNNSEQTNTEAQELSEELNDKTNIATETNSDQPEKEDTEIATIEKYYSFLSDNNLEEAYQMRSDQTVTSYNKFKGWYEDAEYLKPYDFNKTNSGSYKFYVDYKDVSGGVITKFEVEMLVIENKLKTLSSVEVTEKQNESDVSNWLTYTNTEANFIIMYPKTYAVTEYQDNLGIVSFNFKDTNNVDYHGGEIYIKVGNEAGTSDGLLAKNKEECDEYDLCADISENKIVDLSSIKGVRKITYSTAIGGYATSYFFVRENGEKLNFELSLNWEDETRNKIINSFEFF